MGNLPTANHALTGTGMAQRGSYTPALISLTVLYFMMGFITCLNDTLVPFFKQGFALSYSESALTQFYFFLTYGLMSIPASKIVGRVGYKNGMTLGFLVAAFGALLFFPASTIHQYALFLVALFVLAIGIVLLQVAANPYITMLGPARTASSRLTIIQAVGSVGTTVAPLFGAYFILSRLKESADSSEAVKYPYLGICGLLLAIAVVLSRLKLPVPSPDGAEQENASAPSRGSVFSFRNLNLGMLAIFFYVGAEVSIGTFLTNYIADTVNIPHEDANPFVALYWGSMLIGRMMGFFVLRVVRPPHVLAGSAVAAMLLIVASILSGGYLAVYTMIAVGLCNSIMFATIFSLSVQGLGRYTTQASGLLSTAIVGGAVISLAQGMVRDSSTWAASFILPLGCYAFIFFYGVEGYKPDAKHTHPPTG